MLKIMDSSSSSMRYWNLNTSILPNMYNAKQSFYGWLGIFMTLIKFPILLFAIDTIISQSDNIIISILLMLIMVIDILDGEIFNFSKWNTTKIGAYRRMIDAFGDRLVILSILFFLVKFTQYPIAIFNLILLREIVLSFVTIAPLLRKSIVLNSCLPSKAATFLIGISTIFHLLGEMLGVYLCIFIMIPLSIYGIYEYHERQKNI